MRMLAALLYLPSCTYLLLLGNAAFAVPPLSCARFPEMRP
jgi:hypothetical protein